MAKKCEDLSWHRRIAAWGGPLTIARLASHFRNFVMLDEIPVLPRKILELLNSVNSRFWKWNANFPEIVYAPVISADKHIPSRIPGCNELERVLVPSRLVNFPGKFITRRLVLSGIAWLRGITIESTERGTAVATFFSFFLFLSF